MPYRIESIELYVRETPPGRLAFSLGKQTGQEPERLTNPLGHVRMILRAPDGSLTWGCAGDRLSVRWLDKRPGRSKGQKLRDLVELIYAGADTYLQNAKFQTPFAQWKARHAEIMQLGRSRKQEDLTSSFASALFERAMIDAAARAEERSVLEMVRDDRLGFRPAQVHRELRGLNFPEVLPKQPVTRFGIRHTVGLADPLTSDDLPASERVNDGLPETLEEYIRADGLHYFKAKISGDADRDLKRLARLWEVLPDDDRTAVTLDANEAYPDLAAFADFVRRLQRGAPGLFDHLLYIEQPLPRPLTLDPKTRRGVKAIAAMKPLLIDEADGTLTSYRQAHALGYDGTSHKNCKGFFKSLLNRALVAHYQAGGNEAFLSGEDLQNLPIAPLHQDFVTLSILGLDQCERNGHHYNFGLSLLSEKDKASAAKHHRDLYVKRRDEWFLNIRDGAVETASLQCPGFGVRDEPDWASMTPMRRWVRSRFPAG